MATLHQNQNERFTGDATSEWQVNLYSLELHSIQCLLASDYLNPADYTVETLVLHMILIQQQDVDEAAAGWTLTGIVVRLAMRMGLHRDPSHFPNIRPLQAELRRRLWTALVHMDFFSSVVMGLPRLLKDSQCDTRLPANLLPNDLQPETEVMPPEQAPDIATALSSLVHRHPLVRMCAEIYDASEAGVMSESEIKRLQTKLDSKIDALPPWLKYDSNISVASYNPPVLMNQLYIDTMCQKARYLLYRRLCIHGDNTAGSRNMSSRQAHAQRICIDAALAILSHQQKLDEESQIGGLFYAFRWKVAPLWNHEFLQATLMLCIVLVRLHRAQQKPQETAATAPEALHRYDDIVSSLISARALWDKRSNEWRESSRAIGAIQAALPMSRSSSQDPTQQWPNVDFTDLSMLDTSWMDMQDMYLYQDASSFVNMEAGELGNYQNAV